MPYRSVEKEFKWEAAHRLVGIDTDGNPVNYCDNCRHLHGHSYKVLVKVRLRKNTELDEFGMVYDYNKMKLLKKWIDDNLDHCVMISEHDKPLLEFVKTQTGRDKHFLIAGPSTAENIGRVIFDQAQELFIDSRVVVEEVRVNETATSEATYRV